MFAQLGNIIFRGLTGPDSFEHTDSTTYAQHDLINAKPLLQAVGNDLEEIALEIKLRAEFINPELARLQLKKYKDEFQVLPFIKGNGQYLGDFVITEMVTTSVVALQDGSIVESNLSITLREFISGDKLQQQQNTARKQAFAVGDKKPVAIASIPKPTIAQVTATDLAAVDSYAFVVDRKSSEYVNNVTQRPNISDKIQAALQKMDVKLHDINNALANIPLLSDIPTIVAAINAVQSQVSAFSFPITSLDDLRLNNTNLQLVIRNLGAASIEILNIVLTRAA